MIEVVWIPHLYVVIVVLDVECVVELVTYAFTWLTAYSE